MNDTPTQTAAVACLLDGKAYRTRVARIQALIDQALLSRERVETSLRLRFRLDADVETHLKELVALEQECCPFLVFELVRRKRSQGLSLCAWLSLQPAYDASTNVRVDVDLHLDSHFWLDSL